MTDRDFVTSESLWFNLDPAIGYSLVRVGSVSCALLGEASTLLRAMRANSEVGFFTPCCSRKTPLAAGLA